MSVRLRRFVLTPSRRRVVCSGTTMFRNVLCTRGSRVDRRLTGRTTTRRGYCEPIRDGGESFLPTDTGRVVRGIRLAASSPDVPPWPEYCGDASWPNPPPGRRLRRIPGRVVPGVDFRQIIASRYTTIDVIPSSVVDTRKTLVSPIIKKTQSHNQSRPLYSLTFYLFVFDYKDKYKTYPQHVRFKHDTY